MSDPALSPIYNRLNGTSQYHPFSAETFADWSSEAGDTVQITRDGVTYSAPIHQQTITWHGAHRVTMESGGTKDREATERTSNRKYRNSSGGVSSQKSALKQIRYDFYDNNGALHGLIEVTAQGLTTAFQNADAGLQSQITQEAGRISLVVEGTGENAHIKPASIVAAINAQTGTSFVQISADKIDLSGYVTMTDFNSVKGHVDNLTGQTIVEAFCRASLVVGTTVTANNTFVHDGDTIYKRAMRWTSGGTVIATVHATGDTTSIILNHSHEMTVDSSGNVTVGDAQTTTGTFNIADTEFYKTRIASAWNSGGLTAKADQQSQHAPYGGSVVIKIQYVDSEGVTKDTGRSVTIWNSNCSHTFDNNRTFTANGTYYSSTYGYSGFSKVVVNVANPHPTQHNNCADSLTKYGEMSVLYAPNDSGILLNIRVSNISAAGRTWYWRNGSQDTFTAYT